MYYVEIYCGDPGEGFWMYSRENIETQEEAVDHWRECIIDGYQARVAWEVNR